MNPTNPHNPNQFGGNTAPRPEFPQQKFQQPVQLPQQQSQSLQQPQQIANTQYPPQPNQAQQSNDSKLSRFINKVKSDRFELDKAILYAVSILPTIIYFILLIVVVSNQQGGLSGVMQYFLAFIIFPLHLPILLGPAMSVLLVPSFAGRMNRYIKERRKKGGSYTIIESWLIRLNAVLILSSFIVFAVFKEIWHSVLILAIVFIATEITKAVAFYFTKIKKYQQIT